MAQSQYQTNDVQLSPGGSQSCAFLRLDKLPPVSRNTTSVSSRTLCKQQVQGIALSLWLIDWTKACFVWGKINHFKPSLSLTLDSLITNLFTGRHIRVLEVILPEIPTCLNCDLLVNFKYNVFIFKVGNMVWLVNYQSNLGFQVFSWNTARAKSNIKKISLTGELNWRLDTKLQLSASYTFHPEQKTERTSPKLLINMITEFCSTR